VHHLEKAHLTCFGFVSSVRSRGDVSGRARTFLIRLAWLDASFVAGA